MTYEEEKEEEKKQDINRKIKVLLKGKLETSVDKRLVKRYFKECYDYLLAIDDAIRNYKLLARIRKAEKRFLKLIGKQLNYKNTSPPYFSSIKIIFIKDYIDENSTTAIPTPPIEIGQEGELIDLTRGIIEIILKYKKEKTPVTLEAVPTSVYCVQE